eukprot:gene18237-5787_t
MVPFDHLLAAHLRPQDGTQLTEEMAATLLSNEPGNWGPNMVTEKDKIPEWQKFLSQFTGYAEEVTHYLVN